MADGRLSRGRRPQGTSTGRTERRAPRLTFHGSVLMMTLVVLLLMAVPPARQLYRQHTQVQAAERRLDALQGDNDKLEQHLARLEDPDYIEKLARRDLGLVRPGEIGYVVVPETSGTRKKEAPPPPPSDPWYERLLRSIRDLVG